MNNNTTQNISSTEKICSYNETEADVSGEILIMMLLLFVTILGVSLLKKYKFNLIGEALFATIIGLIAGYILSLINSKKEINNITNAYVKFFMIILLPPIIFESGYNLKSYYFFKNFGTILIFAVFGTLLSVISIALLVFFLSYMNLISHSTFQESFAFGSLISATDAVAVISAFKEINIDQSFFQILFGESCLNDAVSIVLYETTVNVYSSSGYSTDTIILSILNFIKILFGSIFIGYIIGFLTAYALKLMSSKTKNMEKTELFVMVVMPFVSYLISEMAGLSGIVSILFNGISHSLYTRPFLSKFSDISIRAIYETVSNLFENLAYIFLGLGFSSFSDLIKQLSILDVIILSIIVLLARGINIILCSKLCNSSRITNHIDNNKQFMLWYSGQRGAMAFALALKSRIDFENKGKEFLSFTLIFSALTLLITDLTLGRIIKKLGIEIEANQIKSKDLDKNEKKSCFLDMKQNLYDINQFIIKKFLTRNNELNETDSNSISTENLDKTSFSYSDAIRRMSMKKEEFIKRSEEKTEMKNLNSDDNYNSNEIINNEEGIEVNVVDNSENSSSFNDLNAK